MEWNGSEEPEGGKRLGSQRERSRHFFCLKVVGSLGSLLLFPLTHTNLWDIPYLSLPFDRIFSFSGFGVC